MGELFGPPPSRRKSIPKIKKKRQPLVTPPKGEWVFNPGVGAFVWVPFGKKPIAKQQRQQPSTRRVVQKRQPLKPQGTIADSPEGPDRKEADTEVIEDLTALGIDKPKARRLVTKQSDDFARTATVDDRVRQALQVLGEDV